MGNAFQVDTPTRLAARQQRVPTVGLFIPCYIDQFYPRVGLATLEVLES